MDMEGKRDQMKYIKTQGENVLDQGSDNVLKRGWTLQTSVSRLGMGMEKKQRWHLGFLP